MNKMTGILFAIVALSIVNVCNAQFEIVSYSIDSGGGMIAGGNFVVQSSIGQPDAGTNLSGGPFDLVGGQQGMEDPILLGDVNGDGVVNLLDVSPFVDAISSGEFIPEADINQDGIVNLLDVSGFIDLLTG